MHTPSQFVADQVVAELGIDPARVRAVHHGIPLPPGRHAGPARPRRPGPTGCPTGVDRYVLAVGTIETAQGLPAAGVGLRRRGRLPARTWRLVIVGGDGWGVERYVEAVEASPARARILRPGYLDDAALAAALRHAVGAGLPVALRRVRVPAVAGHGGRRAGGGHRGGCRARSGRRRGPADAAGRRRRAGRRAIVGVLEGGARSTPWWSAAGVGATSSAGGRVPRAWPCSMPRPGSRRFSGRRAPSRPAGRTVSDCARS